MSTVIRNILKVNNVFNSHLNFQNVRLSSSYKAAVLKTVGEPLVIEKVEPKKKLAKDSVRVKVEYCSVNSVDCLAFKKGSKIETPFIPGYELAGEVIEVGSDIKSDKVSVGDRIASLSLDTFSGFAEQCVVNVNDVWRLPPGVESKDAAVLICGHSTAVFAFSRLLSSPISKDSTILISCGPAGLGLAAVDIAANLYKAKVIGVCDTEDRASLVRDKGAFSALKFEKKLVESVLDATNKKGVDVAYDAVGGEMTSAIENCVALQGKILYAAPLLNNKIETPKFNTSLTIVSLHELRNQSIKLYRQVVSDTIELAEQGLISAHISAKYPLEKLNEAIKYIEDRKSTGKVLIEVSDD